MKEVKYKTKAIRQIKKIKEMPVKKLITTKIRQLENYPDVNFKVSRYKTTEVS